MPNKLYVGSLCITDILENARKQHSSFTKANNGKVYASLNIWLNETKDQYGNIISIQLNPKKDLSQQDGRPYIGNAREIEATAPVQSDIDYSAVESVGGTTISQPVTPEPINDLPF
ncbi:MAG TPA: hypothetical protein VGZ90_13505 [Puia sp.]|jgi:hypothetical protein|nr:hypothetical protein [Puia sp.]